MSGAKRVVLTGSESTGKSTLAAIDAAAQRVKQAGAERLAALRK